MQIIKVQKLFLKSKLCILCVCLGSEISNWCVVFVVSEISLNFRYYKYTAPNVIYLNNSDVVLEFEHTDFYLLFILIFFFLYL